VSTAPGLLKVVALSILDFFEEAAPHLLQVRGSILPWVHSQAAGTHAALQQRSVVGMCPLAKPGVVQQPPWVPKWTIAASFQWSHVPQGQSKVPPPQL
jgi:hypothetical protein